MMQEMTDVEAQVENMSLVKNINRPVTLKFEHVEYNVKLKQQQKLSCLSKCNNNIQEEKMVLKGNSGIVKPGEMLAMLGPSGSGKTTLLTALGGRLSGKLTGTITYNNKPYSNTMKRNIGFVTQDDFMYPHLTVTETLVYTALLRLPNSYTKQEKVQQAESLITQLGLTRCKNSIIGGTFIRGVSGGERKRVSIGQEMLINPSLLFLDEPTSGLDSTTALRIVSTLWDLANAGRTIVMTIHQPSSRLFYMFHKVMLLSEGNSMYFGAGSKVMDYFASIGFSPSVAMNPADFLLDLANGVSSEREDNPVEVKKILVSAYMTNLEAILQDEIKQTDERFEGGFIIVEEKLAKWPTTWWQQFIVLLQRGFKERKHEAFSLNRVAQVLFISFLAGLLWYQTDSSRLQDQIGLMFFYAQFWGFFPLFNAIFTFPMERKMLEKERSSGMYRLSSYFMSRVIGDLPTELALPTGFVIITYWMAGLKATPINFLCTLFSVLYNVLTSQGLGLAIGALVLDQKSAMSLGSVTMLATVLAGGFYVKDVPPFVAWIKYLSIVQYGYRLLMMSQYKIGDTYPCGGGGGANGLCSVADFPSIKIVGLNKPYVPIIALAIMLVGFRVVAYLALRIGAKSIIFNLLRSKDYWELLGDGISAATGGSISTEEEKKKIQEHKLKDMKAKNYLFQAIDRTILETILDKDTSKSIWDSMKQKYQGTVGKPGASD